MISEEIEISATIVNEDAIKKMKLVTEHEKLEPKLYIAIFGKKDYMNSESVTYQVFVDSNGKRYLVFYANNVIKCFMCTTDNDVNSVYSPEGVLIAKAYSQSVVKFNKYGNKTDVVLL